MYAFLSSLSPEQMQAIAEQLYVEMLKAGYTCVGEFHYVHHDLERGTLCDAHRNIGPIIEAASTSGIAITHLPVLYAHGGLWRRGANPKTGSLHQRRGPLSPLLANPLGRYAGRQTCASARRPTRCARRTSR